MRIRGTDLRNISLILSFLAVLSAYPAVPAHGQESGQTAAKKTVSLSGGMTGSGGTMPDLSTGAFSYSIPIEVPPGRRGMDPGLALVYRSTNGNGWVGQGWELEVGSIERNTKNGVDYDGNEFILRRAGGTSELVNISGNLYAEKIEGSFLWIEQIAAEGSNFYWKVTDKSGVAYYYGRDHTSRLDNPGAISPVFNTINKSNNIFKWCLDRVEDRNGNYISISYEKPVQVIAGGIITLEDGQIYLSRIEYTGNGSVAPTNSVIFHRGSRPDASTLYTPNYEVDTRYRLKTIDVLGNGSRVRTYKLSYEQSPSTLRSRLSAVQQYGKDAVVDGDGDVTSGSALPAVTFNYPGDQKGMTEYVRTTSAPNWGAADYTWVGDFNGDGKSDIATAVGGTIWVKVSHGSAENSWFFEERWTTTASHWGDSRLTWAGDFDGDGNTDIATIVSGIIWVKLARPDNMWDQRFEEHQWTLESKTYDIGYTWAGDFNGDGKTDIASATNFPLLQGKSLNVDASTGGGFERQLWSLATSNWATPECTWAGDFDGDGRTDIATTAGGTIWVKHSKPTGDYPYNTFEEEVWTTNATNWALGINGSNTWVGDFNGDGKMDIASGNVKVSPSSLNKTGTVWVKLSTGKSFIEQEWWSVPEAPSSFLSFGSWAGDFNGDGRTDIATVVYSNTLLVKFSNGSSLYERSWMTSYPWRGGGYNWAGDFNGDGKQDLATASGDGTIWVRQADVFPVDLLTTIHGSSGSTTNITYRLSTDFSSDNTLLPFPIQVASVINVNDGTGKVTTTSFAYYGGYYHIADREFRGFNRTVVFGQTGPNNERAVTETWFHQGNAIAVDVNDYWSSGGYMKGKPYKTQVKERDLYGTVLSKTMTAYHADLNDDASYFNPPSQVDSYVCDGDGSCGIHTRTVYGYGAYGNVTTEEFYPDGGSGLYRKNVRTYTSNETDWIVGLPLTEEVRDGSNNLVSSVAYYYDGVASGAAGCGTASSNTTPDKGNITRIKRWFNDPLGTGMASPEVRMAYDGYGNLACTRDPLGNTATLAYDGTFTFPTVATNPKGHSTITKYYGVNSESAASGLYGQVKSVTDPNNTTATTEYDVFGRKTKTTLPDGTWSSWAYSNFGTVGSQHVYTDNNLGLWSRSYFDGLGRTTLQQKRGPNGRTVSTRTEYNATGTVKRSTMPYFDDEAYSSKWTDYTYDALGRTKEADLPLSEHNVRPTVLACFNDGVTVTIDTDKHRRRETRDSMGRLTRVEEYTGAYTSCSTDAGSPYATTNYEYDVRGNLTRVTDAAGNRTEMKYDSLANKYSMSDPDMGVWKYQYYANGNLYKQTDAKGQTITFSYDELNRIKLKDYPTGTDIQYRYDEAGFTNPVGRLTTMVDAAGTTTYNYDSMARPTITTKQIDGVSYAITNSYSNGRLAGITYPPINGEPAGETVSYAYGPGGELQSVRNAAANYVYAYYPPSSYTVLGQPGMVVNGNGVTTNYAYYPQTNRLWKIDTTHSSYPDPLISLSYDYTDGGNIKAIADSHAAMPSLLSSGMTVTYDYWANNKPHAVRSTTDGMSYAYDANGNMSSDSFRSISWNYDNLPSSITIDNATTSFVYDGSGSRAKKNNSYGTTVYIGKLLECRSGVCTKYIYGGGGRIASKSGEGAGNIFYYHQDHLGSTRVVTNDIVNAPDYISYYPFGEMTGADAGSPPVSHTYTSQEFDAETGLYYYNARYYNPSLGRFISADTIVPSPWNPQDFNRYSYVNNNPMNYNDPSGHNKIWRKILIGAAIHQYAVPYIHPTTRGPAIAGTIALITSGGNPGAAIAAATSTAFLNNTGTGRQLVQTLAKEIFVDQLHMHPKYAYMVAYTVINSGITMGIESGFNHFSGRPTLTTGAEISKTEWADDNWTNPVYAKFKAEEGVGGLTTGGGSISDVLDSGGKAFELVDADGNLVGVYGQGPAFGSGAFGDAIGLQHTTAVLKGVDGKFYTSLTGFGGGNIYAATGVCHTMTNQAFWNAGYSNTVVGMSGSGFFSIVSSTLYDNYGTGGVLQSYISAEKQY